MTDTRTPWPRDLVALVTFDGEVRENQAVTRERLAHPGDAPRPLSAALQQWLHLGRRTWVHVSGREIHGIATTRDLGSRAAWEIDTLIDALDDEGGDVYADLLRQISASAVAAGVSHILLRTTEESPAIDSARRSGFRPVMRERWWRGRLEPPAGSTDGVRDWIEADLHACFQVYHRAVPAQARAALAMTLEEWQATRDRRWQERGPTLVSEHERRVAAVARLARDTGQFALQAEPGAGDAADALLRVIAERLAETPEHRALVGEGGSEEPALRRAGLQPTATYALWCLRVKQPVREAARRRAGVAVTGG